MSFWTKREILFQSDRTLVCRVYDETLQKFFIIKSLNLEQPSQGETSRFFHEFEMLSGLAIPGVIPPIEKPFFEGRRSLLFPDHGAVSLSSLLTKPLDLDLFFKLAIPLTQTLGEVHSNGLIHKDINPSNLLTLPDFTRSWIIDFDISCRASRETQILKPVNALEGTLHYLAPEQSGRVNRCLDYRADYYSLGITFFELLFGAKPFHSADTIELLHAHLTQPLPDLNSLRNDVPKPLAQLLQKLAAKDPDDRYQSTSGILSDLRKIQTLWLRQTSGTPAEWPSTFILGQEDFSERFLFPEKLYGRERETEALLNAFEKQNALTLVSGNSGIGKSALIHQLRVPVAQNNGYLLEGKIEQFHQGAQFSGFRNGIQTFFDLLSGDSTKSLDDINKTLREKLRSGVGVLTSLFPFLAAYLGEYDSPAPVGPTETRDRIFEAFLALFETLCKGRCIVFFVDDLQWADPLTLELIEKLVNAKIPGLMLLGAYRSNEVEEQHPLRNLIQRLGERVIQIEVNPLSEQSVLQLLGDALGNAKNLEQLSQLMVQKTGGNPFFTHQLLKQLYAEGMMLHDPVNHAWQIDPRRLSSLQVSRNVMEYLIEKFKGFDPLTRSVLSAGAARGSKFEFSTVAKALSQDLDTMLPAIHRAVQEEIIQPLSEHYRYLISSGEWDQIDSFDFQFVHDRLWQASYELLPEQDRKKLHFQFGEILSEIRAKHPQQVSAIEVADQYLKADLDLVRRDLPPILGTVVNAAVEARASSSFAQANYYIESAHRLCQDHEESLWKNSREAMWVFYREALVTAFLSNDKAAAQKTGQILLERTGEASKRAEICKILSEQARASGQVYESLRFALEGVRCLGMKVRVNTSPLRVRWELSRTLRQFKTFREAKGSFEAILSLPKNPNPQAVALTALLRTLASAAYMAGKQNLVAWVCLIGAQKLLAEGLTVGSCVTLSQFLLTLNSRGIYRLSRELSAVCYKLLTHPISTDKQLSTYAYFIWLVFDSHFHQQKNDLTQHAIKVFDLGFEYRVYSVLSISHDVIELSAPFSPLGGISEIEAFVSRQNQLQAATQAQLHCIPASSVYHSFHAETANDIQVYKERIEALFGQFSKDRDRTGQAQAKGNHGLMSYFFHRYSESLTSLKDYYEIRSAVAALVLQIDFDFFYVLSLLASRKSEGRPLSFTERAHVEEVLSSIASLVSYNREVFGFHHFLLRAEYGAFRNQNQSEVANHYRLSIEFAEQNRNLMLLGLAYERAGEFFRSAGNPQIGRFYLRGALTVYKRWEAWALVAQLEECYPELRISGPEEVLSKSKSGGTTPSVRQSSVATTLGRGSTTKRTETQSSTSHLDFNEVLKAARSLTSEVVLTKLTEKLLKISSEVSGADRGALLLAQAKQATEGFALYARFDLADPGGSEESFELPQLLLDRVRIKKEPIIVDDAQTDERVAREPLFKKKGIRSVICLPAMNQGNVTAVLYLENSSLAGVFTQDRIETLDILASQAAVSIENAKLYQTLEEQVKEKTRDIQAIMDNIQQGIFTLQSDFTLHPEYSSYLEVILGAKDLGGTNPLPLLLNHPSVGKNAQSEILLALDTSLGEPRLNFDFNSHLLPTELTRLDARGKDQILELDWKPLLSVDGITDRILVTLRDVTILKRLQMEAHNQKVELEMIGEILECGIDIFQIAYREAQSYLAKNREVIGRLAGDGSISQADLETLFRNLHTIKGNVRVLGLSYAVDAIHEAEHYLSEQRDKTPKQVNHAKLEFDLTRAASALDRYFHIATVKLGASTSGGIRGSETPERRLGAQLIDSLRAVAGTQLTDQESAKKFRDFQKAYLTSVAYQPLASILRIEIHSLARLAEDLQKEIPQIVVNDKDETGESFLLSTEHSALLKDVFTHCFRNALDHGIETPIERKENGKSPVGTIRFSLSRSKRSAKYFELAFSDDGKGLNLEALKKRGINLGTYTEKSSDLETAELIFHSGVSTVSQVTEVSGRGVGMDAVRALIENAGGSVEIEFTGERGPNGYRHFQLVFAIPESWILKGASVGRDLP